MSTPSMVKDVCWNCDGSGGRSIEAASWSNRGDPADRYIEITCVVCAGSGESYPKPTSEEIAEEDERRWSQGDADYYEGDVA